MPYPTQITAALKTLESTGISRSNYAPPLHRLLWQAGLAVPPPHMASFMYNLALSTVWFAGVWGLLMWFMLWSGQGMSGAVAVRNSAVAGSVFGFCMAMYYRHGARKHKLPRWSKER